MVANPATIPVAIPTTVGLPCLIHSINIQVKAPTDALICVTSIAMPALLSAATALPALNPNHPTHNIAAPITTMVRLCGGIGVCGKPFLEPSVKAQINAATPQVTCTTKPPAKSITSSEAK